VHRPRRDALGPAGRSRGFFRLDPRSTGRYISPCGELAIRGFLMRDFIEITKAMSDPGRVRILLALQGRELCVCQLVELLGLAASTVSKHVAVLRQARLVEHRKEGRWTYYRRAGREAPAQARSALRWLDCSLKGDETIGEDKKRLEEILRRPLEELCKNANRG